MKILQIGKFQFEKKGGIEIVTHQLCKGLTGLGHEVTFICSGEDGKSLSKISENIFIKQFASWGSFRSAPFSPGILMYLLRHRKDFDVLHVHLPNPFATLFILLTRPKGVLVSHWHSDIIKQKILLKLYHPVLMKFLKKTDNIVVTSPNYIEGSAYLKNFREKSELIPLGMDDIPVPTAEETSYWHNRFPGKKIVLSIGRLVYYKSFNVLVRAAEYLGDDYHVVIVGSGEERSTLLKDIETYAPAKVSILECSDDRRKNALISACSVFVLPSSYRSEAYGLVQLEAMQFGKPVISCSIAHSGVSYVNKDGESGITVPVGDHKAIAEAVENICTDEGLYNKLSRGARKRFEDNFRLDEMINNIEKLYSNSI